jgi:hypothetical protein
MKRLALLTPSAPAGIGAERGFFFLPAILTIPA